MAIPQVRTPLPSNFSLLHCPSQPPGSRRRESLAHVPSPPPVPPHRPTRPRPLTSTAADRGPATVREATEAIAAPPPPTSPLHSPHPSSSRPRLSLTATRWVQPKVYPLFMTMGVAMGICGLQLFWNITGNLEVRFGSIIFTPFAYSILARDVLFHLEQGT
uniref:Uncharacterized protein n=1 Tax=Zea mays TaxID=4577 RepID=C0P359_MAIZE|nr:unknown [Zea mays]|eukprot:NP_001168199.1 uncharacterized protein LOC100381955 [Zea mays]